MQRLEVSSAVRSLYGPLGVKGLSNFSHIQGGSRLVERRACQFPRPDYRIKFAVPALIRICDDLSAMITHVPVAAVLVLNTPDDGRACARNM